MKEENRVFSLLALSSIFAFTIVSIILPVGQAAPKQNVTAVVVTIQGTLLVKSAGSPKFVPAKRGQFLYEGDVIKTDKNSMAAITFASGVSLKINKNTELMITPRQIGKIEEEVNMKRGQVFSKVMRRGSHFAVKTPVAVAAVRGTEYDVDLDGNSGRISVLNGNVWVSNAYGNVNVGAGQFCNVNAGEAPGQPQEMSSEDIPQWQNQVRADDKEVQELARQLQGGATSQSPTPPGGAEEKTMRIEVETPSGKKTLNLKLKK